MQNVLASEATCAALKYSILSSKTSKASMDVRVDLVSLQLVELFMTIKGLAAPGLAQME